MSGHVLVILAIDYDSRQCIEMTFVKTVLIKCCGTTVGLFLFLLCIMSRLVLVVLVVVLEIRTGDSRQYKAMTFLLLVCY